MKNSTLSYINAGVNILCTFLVGIIVIVLHDVLKNIDWIIISIFMAIFVLSFLLWMIIARLDEFYEIYVNNYKGGTYKNGTKAKHRNG